MISILVMFGRPCYYFSSREKANKALKKLVKFMPDVYNNPDFYIIDMGMDLDCIYFQGLKVSLED